MTAAIVDPAAWDAYYEKDQVPAFMKRRLLRHFTDAIAEHVPRGKNLVFCELGGGNSFLYPELIRRYDVAEYHVIDNNEAGLDLFRRHADSRNGIAHHADILRMDPCPCSADVTLSAGLVEHFDAEGTKRCLERHAALTKPGGTVILSFPFGSGLYWGFRGLLTLVGLWPPFYERPLTEAEVAKTLSRSGSILHVRSIWSILLTQKLMVVRRGDESVAPS